MVASNITSAIENLREAQAEADMGTSLMIKSRITDLQKLRQRVANINEENTTERDNV